MLDQQPTILDRIRHGQPRNRHLRGMWRLTKKTVAASSRHRLTGLAGEAAFFTLISLPPVLLGLVGTLGYLAGVLGGGTVAAVRNSLVHGASAVLSQQAIDQMMQPVLDEVLSTGRAGIISLGFVLALWSGSAALNVYIDTISVVYGLGGQRNLVRQRLRSASGTGRLDFVRDLWPYVAKEAGWVYYRKLLELSEGADSPALARFEVEYPSLEWGSAEMPKLIGESVPDTALHLDWEEIDRPADGRNFASREEFGTWVRQRLADDLAHAQEGPAASALKATAAMMRDLRDEVRQVISHRGISGASYRGHVDGWFSGMVNFFASGPPARRVEELGALVDAGIVRFVGPRMRVDADGSQRLFSACSETVGDGPVRAASLVEAHLPPTDVRRAADPLLRRLLERGGCRAHRIPNADGTSFETGGIDVTAGQQRLVDASGAAHPGRFSYGPPVESVQWVTAIGARPHVNSRTVQQGDAIARAALEVQE